ncbi:sugar transferase [Planomonospora sp. ID67723]|uniref:sugar transferase n=1 Tax=Planomonospora sp. ID67723 TaxID=2738134 RepID=UPI0018C3BE97|nr:sugar transferase [Planomonospora sp. ID67723]MBG0828117.1 sugar transferase [Planomonospora sp. ID67723]
MEAGGAGTGGAATALLPDVRWSPGPWGAASARRAARRGRRGRRPVSPPGLLGVDLACMAAAVALIGGGDTAVVAATALLAVLNGALGLYRPRLAPSVLDDLPSVAGGGTAAAVLAAALGVGVPPAGGLHGWIPLVLLYTALACGGRWAGYAAARGRRLGPGAKPTLLVGAGGHGSRLAAAMLEHPEYGLAPIGFLDDRPSVEPPPLPVLGGTARLAETLLIHRVRVVVITSVPSPGPETCSLTRVAGNLGCEVFFAPEPGDLLTDFLPLSDHIRSFPVLRMRPAPQARPTWPLKRLMDIVLALAGLVAAAPVLAVCALAVRREGGPGVLFRQHRVGLGGRWFELLKLRTLKPSDAHESATRWSIADDRRMGPAGRLLRRTSLDELPQLWNILRGEMSIVGPRPERPFFVDRFSASLPHYGSRHRVPAGLTGWAQIHGLRGDTSIEDRVRFDNHYIDTWSLLSDIKIIIRTVGSVLRPGGS